MTSRTAITALVFAVAIITARADDAAGAPAGAATGAAAGAPASAVPVTAGSHEGKPLAMTQFAQSPQMSAALKDKDGDGIDDEEGKDDKYLGSPSSDAARMTYTAKVASAAAAAAVAGSLLF